MQNVLIKSSFVMTYFLAQFAYRVAKETLTDMCCISSFTVINLVVSALSWVYLMLLKGKYHNPIHPPIPTRTKLITAALQVFHFMVLSKSFEINTNSVHRFALLLAIPYGLILALAKGINYFSSPSFIAICIFFIGSLFISTDSFTISFQGFYIGVLFAMANAHLASFIETAMYESGSDAISFQTSVAGFRLLFATLLAIVQMFLNPSEQINIQIQIFPICLLVATSALDLTMTVSMTSLIGSSSAVSFLIVEQFCEIMMILIGHTLNPTRFTTFREAVMSFIGFALALPGQVLFIVIGDMKDSRPTDVEPFRPLPADASVQNGEEN